MNYACIKNESDLLLSQTGFGKGGAQIVDYLNIMRDFPGGPVVKTSPSNAGGAGSIPGPGAKIPHMPWGQETNT